MFESIYVGLTGLTGFSKGLNNVSNNIANLNTPGYKSTQLQFADLFYSYQSNGGDDQSALATGSGLKIGGTTTIFKQGELRQTGNDQDAAIDGAGYFVLRQDGKTFYTRAGLFQFDENGFLVDRNLGARVASGTSETVLRDINVNAYRTIPSIVTSSVKFVDNLSVGDNLHEVNVTAFDSQGGSSILKITLTNNNAVTPRSWLLQVQDPAGNTISNGEIRFGGDGSPVAGFNTHVFSFTPTSGTTLNIKLDFGDPGTFSGATNFSAGTESTMRIDSQDGKSAGTLTTITFDEEGFILTTYSNGQEIRRDQLALATFDFPQGLEQIGNNVLVNRGGQVVNIGAAGNGAFGRIAGGSIELSNVDLSGQFTELIVIQRGFQASSQLVSTSNEMIQQLFDIRSGR